MSPDSRFPCYHPSSYNQLEELLLERKHQAAASLIKRVREFSGNVRNATNLGRGVERIFQRVETMAAGMADRLLAEIAAANTLTVEFLFFGGKIFKFRPFICLMMTISNKA